jgi:electron transfer flavoprotein alpha subunit
MLNKSNPGTILIVGETIDGRISAGSMDLARQARSLAEQVGGEPVGVLTGHKIEPAAKHWSKAAGLSVIILDHALCRYPNPCMTASGVEALAGECSPLAVCFPHTMRACQAAAILAWRIKAPCITAVDAIFKENGHFAFNRTILGGKLCETVSTGNTPTVLTIMPGTFARSASPDRPGCSPSVETRLLRNADQRFSPQAIDRPAPTDQALEKAQVVVAAGRGLGGPEHIDLLNTAAGMFKSAAVGASRGACDFGWLPHSRQIGETGRTVAPALYLACGISGAPQHLAGMRESRTIVAVNTDPTAAICNVAHYSVIADLTVFLPVLRERYERQQIKGDAG